MHFDRGAVQAHVLPADGQDLFLLQPGKNPIQHSRFAPAIHPRVDGMPVAKVFGQASPLAAMLYHIKQSIEQLQIGHAHIAALPRQAIGNPLILFLCKLHPRQIAPKTLSVQVVLTGPSHYRYRDAVYGWSGDHNALRKIKPEISVIITSGLDREKEEDTSRRIKASAFLQKPLTAETLLTQVHAVLTGKNGRE
jgi:hypothetical protein